RFGELGEERRVAAPEAPREESGADGEGIDSRGAERCDAGGRIDRPGDDELATQRRARLAHQLQGLGRDGEEGEEVDAGAAERLAAPAIGGDPSGIAAQLRRVAFGRADEGEEANGAAGN